MVRPEGQTRRECVDPPLAWPKVAQKINQSEQRLCQSLSSFFLPIKNRRQRSLKALSVFRNSSHAPECLPFNFSLSVGGGGYGLTIYHPGWPETYYVDEVGLSGAEIRLLPLQSWDQRHAPLWLAMSLFHNPTCLLTTMHTPVGVCVIYRNWHETMNSNALSKIIDDLVRHFRPLDQAQPGSERSCHTQTLITAYHWGQTAGQTAGQWKQDVIIHDLKM